MDGTGSLFTAFVASQPPGFLSFIVSLPREAAYREVYDHVARRVPAGEEVVIVAESFSGPIAVRLAAECTTVKAVVLVNSFVAPPRSRLLRWLPWRIAFSTRPPPFVVRSLLTGQGASSELVGAVRAAVVDCGATLLAQRMESIWNVNEIENLRKLRCPLLYLRGVRDRLVAERSVDVILRVGKNIRKVEIDAPHLLLQTNPQDAWSAITAFLARLAG